MDENKEIIEEEVKVEETETIEDEPKVEEEVQEAAEITEEADEEKKEDVEELTEGVESDESDKEEKPEDSEPTEPEETVEEIVEEEIVELPEKSERELELERQLAEFESEKADREAMATIDSIEVAVETKANEIRNQVVQALEMEARRFGIPTDKSMEDLEKENPQLAKIAGELRAKAEAVLEHQMTQLQVAKEMETAKVVFQKASKLLEKYNLTPEQEDVAAVVFADIVRQVGVNDLGEDLKAKVKLAAAQAKMDIPVDVQKAVEEVKTDTTVLEKPTVEIEEKPKEEVEEKSVEPPTPKEEVDMDAFTESATEGKATGVASVNVENVLEKMAALPFRERTAFYREHIDLINEAMNKRYR